MKNNISKLLIINLLGVIVLLSNLFGAEINKTYFGDKAVEGYDMVAYFTEGKPVEGKKQFTYKYKDANWLFSSQENLDLFKENPSKYEPQYGGWCAWAIGAKGKKYSVEPDLWTIVDGKLYLNYSKSVNEKWNKDIPGFIKKADEIWPSIKDD